MTYEEFLRTKEMRAEACGFDVDRESITQMAFDYQKDIIEWACRKGKCAILTGCGTGKTLILLEFAKKVLKSIAEGDADNAGTNPQTEIGLLGENAETDAAGRMIEPARMTREEMIAAAKNALDKLANGKDWK